ncbi:MAG TPA: hypothetical protein VFZ83_16030 [Acidimicrobiia bacterium]|nr:hypothetical protein [Acidimicrobiia bacterium]
MHPRPDAPRPRPIAQWGLAALWCAVLGWYAFVRSTRVPLLGWVDLGFHELGHLIMYVVPISQLLTAAMGSAFQVAVPLGLATYFAWWRRDALAGAVCLAWAATSMQDASVYIADAPYEALQLIGGEHDWAFVLGAEGLDRLDDAAAIARTVRGFGVVALVVAAGLIAYGAWCAVSDRTRARGPVGATAPTADDRFPTR